MRSYLLKGLILSVSYLQEACKFTLTHTLSYTPQVLRKMINEFVIKTIEFFTE